MRLCDVLRTAGWIAGTLWPEQAVRALRGRDFDAAVARTNEALAVAEESVDSWEPHDSLPGCCTFHEPAVFDAEPDRVRPDRVSRAADSPAAGERTPDNRPAAGRTPDINDLVAEFQNILDSSESRPVPTLGQVYVTELRPCNQNWKLPCTELPGAYSILKSLETADRGAVYDLEIRVRNTYCPHVDVDVDRESQIEHVAALIEEWLIDETPTEIATRIVDMLAADKRIGDAR